MYTSNVNILYRNQYRPEPVPPFGFGNDQISIFAEIPDMVLPRKLSFLPPSFCPLNPGTPTHPFLFPPSPSKILMTKKQLAKQATTLP